MLSQRCGKGHLYSGSTLPWLTRKNHPQKTSIPDGWAQGKHPESKKFDQFCQSTASEKTSNCESALDQEHEQLNSLEARFSKIEEEREQLAVEIRYLQAKDAEFLKQQDW